MVPLSGAPDPESVEREQSTPRVAEQWTLVYSNIIKEGHKTHEVDTELTSMGLLSDAGSWTVVWSSFQRPGQIQGFKVKIRSSVWI